VTAASSRSGSARRWGAVLPGLRDLPSGSCFFAAMRGLNGLTDAQVIAGVNLSMLVDFVFHREAGLAAAVQRARDIGGKAITGR